MIGLLPVACLAVLPLLAAALVGLGGLETIWLDGLRQLVADPGWLAGSLDCLIVGTLVGVVALPLGAAGALGVWRLEQRRRAPVLVMLGLPLLLPHAALAPGLMRLAGRLGGEQDFAAWALAELVFAAPLVALAGVLFLRRVDPLLLSAAAAFGAGPIRRAWLLLPLAWPGLRLGLVGAVLLPFGDVTLARLLAAPAHRALPVRIVDGAAAGEPAAAAAAMLLGLACLLALLAAWPSRLPGEGRRHVAVRS